MPRLCAFGCKPNDDSMHQFPNLNKFPERFKVWVSLVGEKLETSSDYEYYKKKRICDIHFTDADRNRNNRLNALAVPSLHLPGVQENRIVVEEEPSTSMDHSTLRTKNTDVQVNRIVVQEEPSTSMDHSTLRTINTDTSCGGTSSGRVALEHNYATTIVIDRPEPAPERKSKKVTCLCNNLQEACAV